MLSHIIALNWSDQVQPPDADRNFPQGSYPEVKPPDADRNFPPDSSPSPAETELLKLFSILLIINVSRISANSNLCQVISEQIPLRTKDEIFPFLEYLEKFQENCCIIFDGWDEYDPSFCKDVTDIANGHRLPNAYVIIMSQVREHSVLPNNIESYCMVKGFSRVKAFQFIRKMFHAYGFEEHINKIVEFISDPMIVEMFMVPLLLNFLCTIYISDLQLQDNITSLFQNIVHYTICQQDLRKSRRSSGSASDFELDVYTNELITVGQMALGGLTGDSTKTVFAKNDSNTEDGIKLGLLHMLTTYDPTGPVTYQFLHRSIQEYIAAIYITNSDKGFEEYLNYLDSLVKVHDQQLLILFSCGLNPSCGYKLVEKIQKVSMAGTATAAECPGFSWRGWSTSQPSQVEIAYRQMVTAEDLSPFLIKCCWEMSNTKSTFSFPFCESSVSNMMKIEPMFDFKALSLPKIKQLIEERKLSFCWGNRLKLYNLLIQQDCTKEEANLLFSHVSENKSVDCVEVVNVKCFPECHLFQNLLQNMSDLKKFVMKNTTIHWSDMQGVVQDLSVQKNLTKLCLAQVLLTQSEAALCSSISKLTSLKSLHLLFLKLVGFEAHLCHAVSKLRQLTLLDLNRTDLSGARKAFPSCLQKLNKLKWLGLDETNLSEEQTRDVCCLLPSLSDLLLLSLGSLPLNAVSRDLQSVLPELPQLKALCISDGKLETGPILDTLSCLPKSMQVVQAVNSCDDSIVGAVEIFTTLPQLKYVWLDLSSVDNEITKNIRRALKRQGVGLISNEKDFYLHANGVVKLESDIQDECS